MGPLQCAALQFSTRGLTVTDALLNARDTMRYLNVGKSNFYSLRRRGLLPPAIMIGRSPRWRREDLDKWIESQREDKSSSG